MNTLETALALAAAGISVIPVAPDGTAARRFWGKVAEPDQNGCLIELTEENTYWRPDRGTRSCIICQRESVRRHRRAKKEAAA